MLVPAKPSEILAKEINYRSSSPTISKLSVKVWCRGAASKIKTGKMNIIRNEP